MPSIHLQGPVGQRRGGVKKKIKNSGREAADIYLFFSFLTVQGSKFSRVWVWVGAQIPPHPLCRYRQLMLVIQVIKKYSKSQVNFESENKQDRQMDQE